MCSTVWRLNAVSGCLSTCDARDESLPAGEMIHRQYLGWKNAVGASRSSAEGQTTGKSKRKDIHSLSSSHSYSSAE